MNKRKSKLYESGVYNTCVIQELKEIISNKRLIKNKRKQINYLMYLIKSEGRYLIERRDFERLNALLCAIDDSIDLLINARDEKDDKSDYVRNIYDRLRNNYWFLRDDLSHFRI